MLRPDAHAHCEFGAWLASRRRELDLFDEALVEQIARAHQGMHDAVRAMCCRVLHGQAAAADAVQAYEQGQTTMITLLNELRAQVAAAGTHKDVLTGLPLRDGIDYAFALRRKDARRAGEELWLAMIDVDHFKSVNDTYGHAVGDLTLQHIARCLAACMRQSDALFRYGGEEFLGLFLVHLPLGIGALAARVLDAVATAPLTTPSGITLKPTITVGLARVGADEDLGCATERADRALLLGKACGRARFVLAPD